MHLLDINVWIGLAFQRHTNHISATAWFRNASSTCYFCRVTQSGFLRLASNRSVMGASAVSMIDAWHAYDRLFADPKVAFVDEPVGIEPVWRGFTQFVNRSPKQWNDAYLAAFAAVAGFEVVTFDKGFAQYGGVRTIILP